MTDSATSVIITAGPAISGTVADQSVTNQTSVTPFAGVVISDHAEQTETVTVTLSGPGSGTLTNPGGNGSYDAATGVYT